MSKRVLLSSLLTIASVLLGTPAVWAQSAFFTAVTNLNPVAYWPLQETAQPPIADVETNYGSLGAPANAYYSSANVFKGASGIPSGDSDPAVSCASGLNGSFLAVPLTDSRVVLPAGPFTVEVWVYPTNTSASTIIAQTGVAGSGGLNGGANSAGWSLNLGYVPSLGLAMPGTAAFHVYNGAGPTGGAEATATPSGFELNTWYHVVAVYDGTNVVVYVNGVPVSSISPMIGTQARDTWDPLTIGCGRGLNNNRFGGSLDEVAIYTNALTSTQVGNHYNAGTGGGGTYFTTVNGDKPYMWWRMNAPAYAAPAASAYPAAINYGTGVNINGLYLSGTTPGSAGPSYSGMGSPSYACAINGIGTDSTNAIPIFTNGVAYNTNTVAETGIIITNLLSRMNLVTNSMSFMCWFKETPADNRRNVLVGHSDSGWRASMTGGGAVTDNTGKGSDLSSPSPLVYNDGNWHFAVFVYTNSYVPTNSTGWLATNLMYVDGILVSSALVTNANAAGTFTNISIGCAPDHVRTGNGNVYDNQVLAGSIAHVAFFTNALSASQVANLYVAAGGTPTPVITSQPFPYPSVRTIYAGPTGPGTNYIFEAVVAIGGTPALGYQWYYNSSSNYAGATALVDNVVHYTNSTTSQVTITNMTGGDTGYYFCIVTNNYGATTSAIVNVQVFTNPVIIAQSPSGAFGLFPNQNFALSVTAASGALPVGYTWVTNSVADTSAAGSSSSYSLTSVQPAMSGYTYQCIVTNLYGTATSVLATLTVTPLPAALTNKIG